MGTGYQAATHPSYCTLLVSAGMMCSIEFFFFFFFDYKFSNLEESLSPPEAGRTPCLWAQNPRADGHTFRLSTAAVVEH